MTAQRRAEMSEELGAENSRVSREKLRRD